PCSGGTTWTRSGRAPPRRRSTGAVSGAAILAKLVEIPAQLGGKRRLGFHPFAGEGMCERQPGGVQELPSEGRLRAAVDGVADDRKADRAQVDADLMGSSRLEPDAQERVLIELLEELEVRHGVAWSLGVERLAGRIAAVPADRRLDAPCSGSRPAAGQGQGRSLQPTPLYEPLEPLVRLLRPGDDQ